MKNGIFRNISYNFFYQILILIIPFITAPYLARVIGAEGIGTYSYTNSIALYFTYFTMLGLNNYGNREIAKCGADIKSRTNTFNELYYCQLMCFVFSLAMYIVYMIFGAEDKKAALLQLIFLFSALFDINWFFFGIEEFKLTVVRNTIVKIIVVLLVFLFVRDSEDIYLYIFFMCSGYLVSQILLWIFLPKYIEEIKPRKEGIKKHFINEVKLFIPVIATSIYKIMDKIMLGAISNNSEVGYYENAEKIINVPIALICAIGTVMLPRISANIINKKNKESRKFLDTTMFFSLGFSTCFSFGILALGEEFSILFYGKEFAYSGLIMKYLSITIIFLSIGNVVRTQYLIPNGKDKEYILSAIIGAVINIISNLILIPIKGAIGAAIGTVLAEILVCTYQLWHSKEYINVKKYIHWTVKYVFIGCIMYVVLVKLPDTSLIEMNFVYKMLFGGCIYFLLVLFIYKELLSFLKRKLLKK